MMQSVIEVEKVNSFLDRFPTLSQQRRVVGGGKRLASPEEVEDFVGERLYSAGRNLLEEIHQEIYNGLTPEEKENRQKELNGEPTKPSENIPQFKQNENGVPALTPEYLKFIGKED